MHAKIITSADDEASLKELIAQKGPLTEIVITGKAMTFLHHVTDLIAKHSTTLNKIHFSGTEVDGYGPHEAGHFIAKIKLCRNLTSLYIENFRNNFSNVFDACPDFLFALPNLIILSFKNTFLFGFTVYLGAYLTDSQHLELLDMSNSAIITSLTWGVLCEAISKNKSLKILNLGANPIWFGASELLYHTLLRVGNQLEVLKWESFDYQTNEEMLMFLDSVSYYPKDKEMQSQHYRKRFEYFKTYRDKSSTEYDMACGQMKFLQRFVVVRQRPDALFKKTVKADKGRLDLVSAEFGLYRHTLTELSLDLAENRNVIKCYTSSGSIQPVIDALMACQKLQILTIENLENRYQKQIIDLVKAIAQLPELKILTLNNCYLGEQGIDALARILSNIKLTELNLINIGLITDSCFASLVAVLAYNSSLTRLNFGSSPMTISWIRILANFIYAARSTALCSISWSATNFEMMKENLAKMCHEDSVPLYPSVNLVKLPEQFVKQSSRDLMKYWGLFQELLRVKTSSLLEHVKSQKMEAIINKLFDLVVESEQDLENFEEGLPLKGLYLSNTRRYG